MDLENKRRSYFNPRSYKRSDYYRPVPGDPVDEFQSTLLQEERRNHIRKDFPEVFISIHAPTRGATAGFFSSDRTIAHFNPRSYKRSDPVPPAVSALPCYFNPRSYKRSDTRWITLWKDSLRFQSTLLQEERPEQTLCSFALTTFQSTLLQEERQSGANQDFRIFLFQSTLLQEERQQKCTIFLMHLCNNYCIVSI